MAVRTLIGTDLSSASSYAEAGTVSDGDTVIVRNGMIMPTSGLSAWNSYTTTGLNLIVMAGASLVLPLSTALACKWASIAAYGQLVMSGSGSVVKGLIDNPGCNVTFTGGTVTNLITAAGNVEIGASAAATDLFVRGGTTVVRASGASDRIDNLRVAGGVVVTERPVSTLRGFAGRVVMQKAATVQDGSSGGAAYLEGRNFELAMECEAAQTIDALYGYAGTLNPGKMGGDLTITNTTRHGGLVIRDAWGAGKIVYTNTPTDVGYFAQYIGGGPVV